MAKRITGDEKTITRMGRRWRNAKVAVGYRYVYRKWSLKLTPQWTVKGDRWYATLEYRPDRTAEILTIETGTCPTIDAALASLAKLVRSVGALDVEKRGAK